MSPLDAAVVRRKMQRIVEALRGLGDIEGLGWGEYARRTIERNAAERMLQMLVDAAVDINLHVISSSGRDLPEDSYGSFIAMGSAGILDPELAEKLAPAAGLRNRLVHQYDDLDDRKVWESISVAQTLMPRYLKALESYLEAS